MHPSHPKKSSLRLALLLLAALFLLSACAPAKKPAMWKATDEKGHELYLFGSIHAANEGLYPLPEVVNEAYEASDALAVEIDILSMNQDAEASTEMTAAMLLPEGESFAEQCDPQVYEKLKSILTKEGLFSPMFDGFGPVFWQLLLGETAMDKAGMSAEYGVDMHFLTLAHESGKEVLEIESLELQIALLTDASAVEDARAALPELVNDFDAAVQGYKTLLSLYSAGNVAALERMMAEGEDAKDPYSITGRNPGMAQKAAEYLASGKRVFFVVGAAHLAGDNGVPALLAEMGFTVERVDYDEPARYGPACIRNID